jgi:hypothetical protein
MKRWRKRRRAKKKEESRRKQKKNRSKGGELGIEVTQKEKLGERKKRRRAEDDNMREVKQDNITPSTFVQW